MPSHMGQSVKIYKGKSKKNGKTPYIAFMKPDGYLDVWIYNHHYHLVNVGKIVSKNGDVKINIQKVIDDYEAKEQKKKGVIVIRRK